MRWLGAIAVLCALTGGARAELTIEIRQGVDEPVPIAVVPFAWAGETDVPLDVAAVVSFDLARSGQLAPLAVENMLSYPTRPDEVFFRDWRVQGIEYLVIGTVTPRNDGLLSIEYWLYDVYRQQQMAGERLDVHPSRLRDAAHAISDVVYEQMTGLKGAYSTRLMYVLARNMGTPEAEFRLEIADVDGARPYTLVKSSEPILSAEWAPDGQRIAYVSFESGRPGIYLQSLRDGSRERIASFPGLNSAPTFSPDGKRLAMVLSRDGNPEVYIMDLETRALTRVTRNRAIDTEPAWAPDGQKLIFTSNRGGGPQIYQVDLRDGLTDRLTFVGDYNARGRLLPDGRHLVFVHRREGIYHIALLNLETDRLRVLTETNLDESPSVAPNGSMLIYATRDVGGRGILAAVSIDGSVKYRLPSSEGDVREPAWSPYLAVGSLTEPHRVVAGGIDRTAD